MADTRAEMVAMTAQPTYSESDLAEARELRRQMNTAHLDAGDEILAAALAERERRVWSAILALSEHCGITAQERDRLISALPAFGHLGWSLGGLAAILKAAREATKP